MFKIITTLTITLAGFFAQAQVSQTRDLKSFDKIKVNEGIEVIYTDGQASSLKVETATTAYLSDITTEVRNNTLSIESKNPDIKAKVYVSANNLTEITVENGSKFRVSNEVNSETITISLSDASMFNGNVTASNLSLIGKQKSVYNIRVDAARLEGLFIGGSKANISGKATAAELTTGNKSLCHARNLITEKASIDAGENATMLIAANEEIAINLTDTSNVTYYGSPRKVSIPEFATAKYKSAGGRMLSVK